MEDAARLSNMEESLRQNIGSVLSDEVDKLALNGSGTGDGTINGLLNILTNPAAPAASAESVCAVRSRRRRRTLTGCSRWTWAESGSLSAWQTYGAHGRRSSAPTTTAMTAEGWLMDRTGGVRTSRRIAAGCFQHPTGDRPAIANPAGRPRRRHACVERVCSCFGTPIHRRRQRRGRR